MTQAVVEPEGRVVAQDDLSAPVGAVRDSLAVAVWTIVSRVTGVLRGVTIAAVLGATYLANTYQFTNSLPNLVFYGVLAGSLFSSLLAPALVSHLDSGDMQAARAVAGGLLGIVTAAMVLVVPASMVVAPAALHLATSGAIPAESADQARIGGLLVLMLMPQVPLYAVIGTATAVMNAQRRFALAAAAPALENLGTIAVLGAVAVLYPRAWSSPAPPAGLILLLGLGTTAAVALHAGVQWWGARRVGVTLVPLPGWRNPEVGSLLRRALPASAQAAMGALQVFVLIAIADRIPGGVVAFQLATNFFYLPIAVAATPVALSLAPRLSRMVGPQDLTMFRDTLVRGLGFALFLATPAAVAYVALAGPLADALSFGAFRAGSGAPLVSSSLMGLAPGVVGEAVFMICTYACYARGDTATPLGGMVLQAGVSLGGAFLAVMAAPDATMLGYLGLAYSAGAVVSAATLLRVVLRGLPRGDARLLGPALRALGAAVLMIPPAVLVAALLGRVPVPGAAVLAVLGAAVTGAVVYFGAQRLLGADELAWISGAVPTPSLPRWRRPRGSLALNAATLSAAAVVGILVAVSPRLAFGVLATLTLAGLVWWRPPLAAYIVVVVTPLTAGIDRGRILPVLRPNEAVLFLMVATMIVRYLFTARTGLVRLRRPSRIEWSLLALGVCSSVLPVFVMLTRTRDITTDDINYSLVIWKLLLMYVLVRACITTRPQALRCLWLLLLSGGVVSLIAILQSLSLFGVPSLLAAYYAPFGVDTALAIGRGSSTLSLPAAVADLATIDLLIALGLLLQGRRHRLVLAGFAVLSAFGVFAAAEFSTVFGMIVALVTFVLITGYRRLFVYAVPIGLLSAVILEPVFSTRLAGFQSASGMPVSWVGRLNNLRTYFWPDLSAHWNWVFGVRPAARVPSVAQEFGWIWIESGYTWLLWGGGIPLLVAYCALVVTAVRTCLPDVRSRDLSRSVTAAAVICYMAANAFVMLFDPHVTYRGAAEAMLTLLALAGPLASGAVAAASPGDEHPPSLTTRRSSSRYRAGHVDVLSACEVK